MDFRNPTDKMARSMADVTEELYRRVYLIRRAEEAIIERYMGDEMKTPVHLSIGQEAISAGICYSLSPEDQIVGSYRSHGIYLSRTLETDRFFAEIYGRSAGIAKGKAGSMHLSSKEHGYLGSSAVVGTYIPVGVGAALANRIRGRANWVAVFLGDGAVDEGVFYESLNIACLKRLKVIFVCEDNGLAIHSHARDRHAYGAITDIARQYPCEVFASESTVAEEIYALVGRARTVAEESKRPIFLHLKCYRYLEHVGISPDFKFGYRPEAEFARWKAVDPVLMQRKLLERRKPEAEIARLERAIDAQIVQSIDRAEKSPFPTPEEVFTDVFA